MRSSREFALLTLLKDAADTLEMERREVDAMIERQLSGLEKLAARQRRLRAGQSEQSSLMRSSRKLS